MTHVSKARQMLAWATLIGATLALSGVPHASEEDDAFSDSNTPHRLTPPVFPVGHFSARRPMTNVTVPPYALALCMPDLFCSLRPDTDTHEEQTVSPYAPQVIRTGTSR